MINSNTQYILVTGASGFIGKDLVVRLLKHGWFVRAMVRKTSPLSFPKDERLQVVFADMRHAESLQSVAKDVSVVIHLATRKSDEEDSEDVNIEGAKRLVEACKKAGCKRIINISTQSAKIHHKGIYARTKSEADKVFHRSGLEVTTLRPSIVYGEEKSGVFGTVLRIVQRTPVVPVLGNGTWLSAPVYVGDVSEAIIACIAHDNTIGNMYDLGGPELISFDQLIDMLCAELRVKRLKLHIPFHVALAAANIIAKLLSTPPITVSNVLGSNQNTAIDISAARRDFDFDPINFKRGLKTVLGKIPKPWPRT